MLHSQRGEGWMLNVVPPGNVTIRMMTNMFSTFAAQMIGIRYRSFGTLEEAANFLKEQDDQLAGLME